jgi:Ca2+-binding RTX toxin-like protein
VAARLLIAAAIVASCALAPAAQATIRVELAGDGGLVITDRDGNLNDVVTLGHVSADGGGLEWEIARDRDCGRNCFDLRVLYEVGSGCRFVAVGPGLVRCTRLAASATVNLLGGNDRFKIAPASVGMTDPITLSLGAGDDTGDGAAGDDTLQGGSGDDRLDGKAGGDLVQGSIGNDFLIGDLGNDNLTGSDGADVIVPGVGQDTGDAGAGNDEIQLGTFERDERDDFNGGIGFDRATYVNRFSALRIIEANLETLAGEKDAGENDVLRSIESYAGGRGPDILTGVLSSNASTYLGEGGNDQIFGSSGNNTVAGGAGADQLDGNAGNDTIDAKSGEGGTAAADPVIDCGTGTGDRAILDLTDDPTPTDCDGNIDRSAAGEGPHVRLKFRRRVAVRGGRVSARLKCPRALRRGCRGTLAVRIGKARSPRSRYSVKRGRTRRVLVRLGALRNRVGRRTVGQLVSVERGRIKGLKTTSRGIVLQAGGSGS